MICCPDEASDGLKLQIKEVMPGLLNKNNPCHLVKKIIN